MGGRRACSSLFTASAEPFVESPELLLTDNSHFFILQQRKTPPHSSAFQNPSFVLFLTTLN